MKESTFTLLVLCSIILLYLVIGGLVFHILEKQNEVELFKEYENILFTFKKTNNVSDSLMKSFLDTHLKACNLGAPISLKYRRWGFAGAVYFAGTILTTIGYGHASPETFFGRIIFILYALTSIPLNMLLLNLLLERSVTSLNNYWKKVYTILSKKNLLKTRPEKHSLSVTQVFIAMLFMFLFTVTISAVLFMTVEEWGYFESIYFTIVSFTTVGLGDFVPSKDSSHYNSSTVYQLLNLFVIMVGSIVTYIFMNLLATIYKNILHYVANTNTISCVKIAKPARSTSMQRKFGLPRRNTGVLEDNTMGSFAAIQRAIDRIRTKAGESESGTNELKAVNTIEAILQSEFQKVSLRSRDNPKSARRKYSNVYNSVLIEGNVLNIASPSIIRNTGKISIRSAAMRRETQKQQNNNNRISATDHSLPNTSTPNPQPKISINEITTITYDDIIKNQYENRKRRRSTKSTYLPDDLSERSPLHSPLTFIRNESSVASTHMDNFSYECDDQQCKKDILRNNRLHSEQHSMRVHLQNNTDSESDNDGDGLSAIKPYSGKTSSAYFSSDISAETPEALLKEHYQNTRNKNNGVDKKETALTSSNHFKVTSLFNEENGDRENSKGVNNNIESTLDF